MPFDPSTYLVAHQVSYAYPRRGRASAVDALSGVSLAVTKGSFTGLLGPNGCGKTTLLKLMAGVLRPASGAVTLEGRVLADLPRRLAARHVAVVPQDTHPAFDYTALEIVLMGRHPHLRTMQLEGPADLAIARESLEATGTAHLAHRAFTSLSGGERQRVVIASALAQRPEVLLLDEPTASLDLGYQLEVAALLRQLSREQEVTMVMATHDLNLAASMCDTLALLRDGRLLGHGPTDEVLTAAMVRQLYDVEADVQRHDRAGHLTVTPVRRAG
ncbi:MAG TPA: ABC transporter ATP-binding protein [Vicinamibacterales bacterium]|nr:ABC transporter ATP-binding protein [Vicinamibacterales bacterium]